jgi:MraZ protein
MAQRMYNHKLDAKNRMRMPPKVREKLGDDYAITIGTRGCLYVLTKAEYEKIQAMASAGNRYDPEAQDFASTVAAFSCEVEEDSQGRLLLPNPLKKLANIDKDILILDTFNGVEIWAQEVWDKKMETFSFADFDKKLASLSSSGKLPL